MNEDAIVDLVELDSGEERNNQKALDLPKRCRSCSELANCDLDFCLLWWH